MKIVLIGCTLTTRRCLEELVRNEDDQIVLVLTLASSLQASKSRFAPLEDITGPLKIPLQEITDINHPSVVEELRDLAPDVIFEIGWSQIINRQVLDIPARGCIGIHDSLLPKSQGAASINWALIHGEPTWGVSLFYLEEQFDKGDVIGQRSYVLDDNDDINTAFDKADSNAVALLKEMVPKIRAGTAPRIPQDPDKVTKTRRRRPQDGIIDWNKENREIFNLVRALRKPFPPAFTFLRGQKIFILDSRPSDVPSAGQGVVGLITLDGLIIGTGHRSLLVPTLQLEDAEEMDAIQFSTACKLQSGDCFDN